MNKIVAWVWCAAAENDAPGENRFSGAKREPIQIEVLLDPGLDL